MIRISTDLFQTIVLALMFVILIALIALLAAINGLKKSLGSAERTEASSYGDTASYPSYSASTSVTDTGYCYGSQPAAQPAAAARPEVSTSYEPVSQVTESAAQPAATSTQAPSLTGTEPEEQPFERDGRWWFKRGGELLVYDEGTGQWVAAGSAAGGATAGGATVGGATTEAAGGYTPSTSAGDPGEGWRCSSCGAINGSTATVCRMCFTPR